MRKKWTTPVQRKNEKPAVKKGKGGQKRKLDVQQQQNESEQVAGKRATRKCKAQRQTLVQEFDEIIKSAQSTALCPKSESQVSLPCSAIKEDPLSLAQVPLTQSLVKAQAPLSAPTSPLKLVKVMLDNICSPLRPICVNFEGNDAAPSPVTPLLPPRVQETVDKKDEAPSPQGMNLSSYSSDQSLHFVTQSVFIKEESAEINEISFSNEQNSSLGESGMGLDLDCLIDEIFVKNSDCVNAQQCTQFEDSSVSQAGANIYEPDADSEMQWQAAHVEEHDPFTNFNVTNTVSAQKRSGDCKDPEPSIITNQLPASLPIQSDLPDVMKSEAASCGDKKDNGATLEIPTESQIESAEITKNMNVAALPNSVTDVLTDSTSKQCVNKEGNVTCLDISSQSTIADGLPEETNLEEFLNEDLSLSDSQFLELDAKCLSKEDSSEQVEIPQKDTTHANSVKLCELQVRPSHTDCLVPPAPRMDWVQKFLENRQRLRTVTQEVSRLNAMVLRARRTLWPRQQQSQATLSAGQNLRLQQTVPQLQQPEWPNMHCDPDWNIS